MSSERTCPTCGKELKSKNGVSIHRQSAHNVPWQDEAKLRKAYVKRRLQVKDIAEEWDTTPKNIRHWLRKHGIEQRDAQEESIRGLRRKPAAYFTRKDGYVRWKDHSNGEHNHVYVHRLLAVAEHGTDAVADMDVHHKNGIPWDNRPENIELISKEEHGRHHSLERWRNE